MENALNWVSSDPGTTNSVLHLSRPNFQAETLIQIPSCIFFSNKSAQVLYGENTNAKKLSHPENTVYDAKRLIGARFNDENVQKFAETVGFAVVDSDGGPHIQLTHNGQNRLISPEEIEAIKLRKIRLIAQNKLKAPLTRSVIVLPAKSGQRQRSATIRAAKMAGFTDCVQLINETTAAAYAYGFQLHRFDEYKILVLNFGGGNLEIAISFVKQGLFEVKSSEANKWLGGREIDLALREHCFEWIRCFIGRDIEAEGNRRNMLMLLERCEKAKIELSEAEGTRICLDFLDIEKPIYITRAVFEDICRPILLRGMEMVRETMNKAKVTVEQIDEVLLVGGTSYIPLVHELLELEGGFPAEKLNRSLNRMQAVAQGAAVLAAQLTNEEIMPEMKLLEATPLLIWARISNSPVEIIVPENTKYPCKIERQFATLDDGQDAMDFDFYEGIFKPQKDCLGRLHICPLPKGKAGTVLVMLALEIDRNGILHAIASHGNLIARMDTNIFMAENCQTEYQIIDGKELLEEMNNLAEELNGIMGLGKAKCKTLLRSFKCDKMALLKGFHESSDAEHWLAQVGMLFKRRSTIKRGATKHGVCQICFGTSSSLMGLACAHLFCPQCWTEYLAKEILGEGRVKILCAAQKCAEEVDEDFALPLLLLAKGERLQPLYQRLQINSYVENNPLVKWCPAPNCTKVVKVESARSMKVECACGGYAFCFHCLETWHAPISCALLRIWLSCRENSGTSGTNHWLGAHTTNCPNCKAAIEKNGGCDHMTCRACAFQFCWLCLAQWNTHNSSNCNKSEQQKREKTAEKIKIALHRHLLCCDRFKYHENLLGLEKELSKKIRSKTKLQKLTCWHSCGQEIFFLVKGVDALSECRRVLMYSYAFTFFLDQDDGHTRSFEETQQGLEIATEQLSEFLMKYSMDKKELASLKTKLIEMIGNADERRQRMIQQSVEGTERGYWRYNQELGVQLDSTMDGTLRNMK